MKKLLLSPYAQKMRNNEENPKNFPYWEEVVKLLKEKDWYVIQIGIIGEKEITGVDEFRLHLKLNAIESLVRDCTTWVSVDNFLPHLCSYTDRRGVVIFGPSDPNLFGYPENINLIKSRDFLREKQFDIWEAEKFDQNVFVTAQEVVDAIESVG